MFAASSALAPLWKSQADCTSLLYDVDPDFSPRCDAGSLTALRSSQSKPGTCPGSTRHPRCASAQRQKGRRTTARRACAQRRRSTKRCRRPASGYPPTPGARRLSGRHGRVSCSSGRCRRRPNRRILVSLRSCASNCCARCTVTTAMAMPTDMIIVRYATRWSITVNSLSGARSVALNPKTLGLAKEDHASW